LVWVILVDGMSTRLAIPTLTSPSTHLHRTKRSGESATWPIICQAAKSQQNSKRTERCLWAALCYLVVTSNWTEREFVPVHSRYASRLKAAGHVHISAPLEYSCPIRGRPPPPPPPPPPSTHTAHTPTRRSAALRQAAQANSVRNRYPTHRPGLIQHSIPGGASTA
jgi:hypothetical protein